MKTKMLVDTNLWIYAYDKDSVHHQTAVSFLSNSKKYHHFICTKNISEFLAVTSKLNQPFEKVSAFLEGVRANTILLFPSIESVLIFDELVARYQPRGNKVYDLEMASIALANQITKIATKNTSDFEYVSEIDTVDI